MSEDLYPTAAEARRHSRRAAADYAETSRWGWNQVSGRLTCEPHPRLPCLLEPSVAPRGQRWAPCWVLFAGRDQPGWRFYQWVSARNDDTPALSMNNATEVVEHMIGDFVYLVERSLGSDG